MLLDTFKDEIEFDPQISKLNSVNADTSIADIPHEFTLIAENPETPSELLIVIYLVPEALKSKVGLFVSTVVVTAPVTSHLKLLPVLVVYADQVLSVDVEVKVAIVVYVADELN